jgi:hypothetical protein
MSLVPVSFGRTVGTHTPLSLSQPLCWAPLSHPLSLHLSPGSWTVAAVPQLAAPFEHKLGTAIHHDLPTHPNPGPPPLAAGASSATQRHAAATATYPPRGRLRVLAKKHTVREAKSSLGDAKSLLGDVKSSLGDAESSLSDVKSSLGDAKSSLGDAQSSLGDAKSSLGDANRRATDRRWSASWWRSTCWTRCSSGPRHALSASRRCDDKKTAVYGVTTRKRQSMGFG